MPLQGGAPSGNRKDSLVAADCRSGVRRKPALFAEARGFLGAGSAHGMDRQSGFESYGITLSFFAGDVLVGSANMADLFTTDLQIVAAIATTRTMDLQEVAPARANSGARSSNAEG